MNQINSKIIVSFSKFIISVRSDLCDYSLMVQKELARLL